MNLDSAPSTCETNKSSTEQNEKTHDARRARLHFFFLNLCREKKQPRFFRSCFSGLGDFFSPSREENEERTEKTSAIAFTRIFVILLFLPWPPFTFARRFINLLPCLSDAMRLLNFFVEKSLRIWVMIGDVGESYKVDC